MNRRLRTYARWIAVAMLATLAAGLYALAFVDLPRLMQAERDAERIGVMSPGEVRTMLAECERRAGRWCVVVALPVPHYGEKS